MNSESSWKLPNSLAWMIQWSEEWVTRGTNPINQHGSLTLTVKTNCSRLLHNHNDVHWLNGFLQMKIYVLFSPPFIICCIRTLASGTKGDNSARGTSDDGRCFVLAWGRHAHQFLCHLIPNPSHQDLCVYYYIAL